jgi:hypothetical protein
MASTLQALRDHPLPNELWKSQIQLSSRRVKPEERLQTEENFLRSGGKEKGKGIK